MPEQSDHSFKFTFVWELLGRWPSRTNLCTMSSAHGSSTGAPASNVLRAHSGSSAVAVAGGNPWKPSASYLTGTAAAGRRSTRRVTGGATGEYSPASPSCATAAAECSTAEEYSPASLTSTATAEECSPASLVFAAAGRLRPRLPRPGAEAGCPTPLSMYSRAAMALHKFCRGVLPSAATRAVVGWEPGCYGTQEAHETIHLLGFCTCSRKERYEESQSFWNHLAATSKSTIIVVAVLVDVEVLETMVAIATEILACGAAVWKLNQLRKTCITRSEGQLAERVWLTRRTEACVRIAITDSERKLTTNARSTLQRSATNARSTLQRSDDE